MLFRRRKPLQLWQKIRNILWPSSGWVRAFKYLLHRLARIPDTPHSVAAGVASGIAVSFTPFLGLHFVMAFTTAWATRGNLLAAAVGTVIGNPWTFPLIFAATANIGSIILGRNVLAEVPDWSWDALTQAPVSYITAFVPLVWPLIIGGILLGLIAWLLAYFFIKGALEGYRRARVERLQRAKSLRILPIVRDGDQNE